MRAVLSVCAAMVILSFGIGAADLRAESPPLKISEAIAAHERLIENNPGDPALYNDLGNLLLLDDRRAEAEAAYEKSIELDPEMASVRYNYALLLQQSDRPRRAEREYRRVLKSEPENAWAHYQVGVLLAQRGKRTAAIRNYARAMRLNPRLTDPAFNPHIVENALASNAVLLAYADLSSAALAPRVYENPRTVTSILLAAQAGAPNPEKRLQRRLERKQERKAKKRAAESN